MVAGVGADGFGYVLARVFGGGHMASSSSPQEALRRLPHEPARAHGRLVKYAALGPGRSLARIAAQIAADEGAPDDVGKLSAKRRQVERWSSAWDWQKRVTAYDDALTVQVARDNARHYRAELEDHRVRYGGAGKVLYNVAGSLLERFRRNPEEVELTPQALAVVVRALTTAADLEAHALGLDQLLPRLSGDEDP